MPPPSGDGDGNAGGAGAGGCPFAGAAGAAGAGVPTTCPVANAAATAAANPTTTPAPQPAVCPFGFGAGGSGKGGAASTPLHCPLCRSLLFECRAAKPCGHKACAECLSRFSDCPLCGADVEGSEPDPGAQGMVDAFLGAHGVYPDAVAAALDMGPLMQELMAMSGVAAAAEAGQQEGGATSNKAALTAALLHGVALRSYAGGNVSAALARFEAAREALVRVLEEEEKKEDAKTNSSGSSESKAALALGMVLGGLGDCHGRRGNVSEAEASYRASAERLAAVAGVDLAQKQQQQPTAAADANATPPPPSAVEARRALGVTLNKLGDLAYARGDVAGALKEYRRALELRRARLQAVEKNGAAADADAANAAVDARLDLAAALIKAGDAAARAPGGADDDLSPAACFAEARALLQAVGGGGEDEAAAAAAALDRAQRTKRDRLLDALAAVQGGASS